MICIKTVLGKNSSNKIMLKIKLRKDEKKSRGKPNIISMYFNCILSMCNDSNHKIAKKKNKPKKNSGVDLPFPNSVHSIFYCLSSSCLFNQLSKEIK